ncbi:hypothetical protein QBC37DRAFT_459406 [Rhypophila decipiens]|uniref:Uncharacterized protein n=1 Tax=Rhypophila decipiens TaxID=261697 RepID=A0AAN6YC13_9PEZI|nr:hypothetical protein QBC37DRAFT_459406 [Rhypophila decipiens]
MGFRSLLGLDKSSDPKSREDIPSLSTEIVPLKEAWQGNLPCVHGATDGCATHNPAQTAVFFDTSLFAGSNTSKIKPSGNHKSNDPPDTEEHIIPTVESFLPKSVDSLTVLPKVHKSVAFSLAFYHVQAVMASPDPSLTAARLLSCRATTGSNPALSWTVQPLIQPATGDKSNGHGNLLLKYTLSFGIKADLGSWTETVQHGRAVTKEMLIGSGYRDFSPCPHTHLAFTSHKGEGRDHFRYAGVHYTRKKLKEGSGSSKWIEEKGEWKSEVLEEPIEPICCARCYTDCHVEISTVPGGAVVVCVSMYKDLGEGRHWADAKWLSLARGVDLQPGAREASDFGRMRRAFVENGLSL